MGDHSNLEDHEDALLCWGWPFWVYIRNIELSGNCIELNEERPALSGDYCTDLSAGWARRKQRTKTVYFTYWGRRIPERLLAISASLGCTPVTIWAAPVSAPAPAPAPGP